MQVLDWYRKIDERYRITFISTFIIGLIAHGMALFNKYSFHDDICSLFDTSGPITSGRWAQEALVLVQKAIHGQGVYSLPLLKGLMSILFIALTACFLVGFWNVQSQFACILFGGLMVSFPVITHLFAFMFTAPAYMFALWVGVTGTIIICRKPSAWKWLISVFAISCAIGVYQAYIPFYLVVILLFYIQYLLKEEPELKEALKEMLYLLFSCIAYMGLYFLLTKFFLAVTHYELSDYQGISTMGFGTPGTEYLQRLGTVYKEFFIPTADKSSYMFYDRIILFYWGALVLLLLYAVAYLKSAYKKSVSRGVLLTICMLIFPLAVDFIFFMVSPKYVHSLMVYSHVCVFLVFIICLDHNKEAIEKKKIIHYLLFGTGCLLLFLYCRYANICYLRTELAQQEAISYFTTFVTQIKSVNGYNDNMPVVYINDMDNKDATMYEVGDNFTMADSVGNLPEYANDYEWKNFMRYWCGFSPKEAYGADFKDLPEVKQMPSYPDDGSIKVINNTVVVKY